MSRSSRLPEAKRSLPRLSDSRTCAGVSAACSALSAARSRRCGDEVCEVVEQPIKASRSNDIAAIRGRSLMSFIILILVYALDLQDFRFQTILFSETA